MQVENEKSDSLKPRLLLVEDDNKATTMIIKYLEKRFEIDSATNCDEAISKAKEKDYDAFLMDIGLPGKSNGMDTTKKLKEIKSYKYKPFIAVTAYAMPEYKEYFLSEGLTHYIAKPFEAVELIKLIDVALGRN
jgi:DNA-binding response OmpR family regulator